jgi:hypothetical protein
MKEDIKELASVSEELKALVDAGVIVNIDIVIDSIGDVLSPDPDQPPVEPPTSSATLYRISCADKPSRQVKLRPQPSSTVSEIARLPHGTIVGQGSLNNYGGFVNVYVKAQPSQVGWVEKEYLVEVV